MIIDLLTLPDDGQLYEGELPTEVFDLENEDARPLSPLQYALYVQRFDSELLLTGQVEATFELTCHRTLHPFRQTIHLPKVAIGIEIKEGGPIDATEAIREEVLIELPTNPRCDEGDEELSCEIDEQYLAVDKPEETDIDSAPARGEDNPWDALDALDAGNSGDSTDRSAP